MLLRGSQKLPKSKSASRCSLKGYAGVCDSSKFPWQEVPPALPGGWYDPRLIMSTYTLFVESRFEAAHHLTSYRGRAEPIHGHSWRVQAELCTADLDPEGMGFDFVEIKAALGELAARFHHRHINDVPPFDELSPTTERLARWFYDRLAERLPAAPFAAVRVWEGPDCSASYRPGPLPGTP